MAALRILRLLMLISWALPNASADEALLRPTQAQFQTTFETLTLPASESMGFLGGHFLYETKKGFFLGPAAYGALTGKRGGFITLGWEADLQGNIGHHLGWDVAGFVGAGGGRGGFQLSGGGLMFRGHAALALRAQAYRFLIGISVVDFPDGTIHSTQPFLGVSRSFRTLILPSWPPSPPPGNAQISPSIHAFGPILRVYRVPPGVRTDAGTPQHPSIRLMGVEWRHFLDRSRFVRIESEGAMGGRSNGYMQILLGGGYRWSITPLLALDIMASAGVAGGGRVDTGGGLLLDAQLGLVTQSKSGYFFELSIGHVWAPQASFKAHSASARIGRAFAVPKAESQEVELADLAGYSVLPLRIRAAHQMYSRSNPRWRTHHADLGFNNLGAQVDYFPTAWLFLTGQGLAAYSGKAGAYMIGLLGLGIHLGGTVFAEAEALIGAAGGGGAAVGGGLVRQVNAGIGLRLNETTDIVAKVGRLEAFHGRFQARVWGLSLGYRFATFTRSPQ